MRNTWNNSDYRLKNVPDEYCSNIYIDFWAVKKYNVIEERRYTSVAKMGRPKAEKPKTHKITVRFSDEEFKKLAESATDKNQTIAQTVREGLKEIINPSK